MSAHLEFIMCNRWFDILNREQLGKYNYKLNLTHRYLIKNI